MFIQLEQAASEIKTTGRCTDSAILDLERQIQVVAKSVPHSHSRCANQAMHIKALMVSERMPTFWITLNPSNLQSLLVLTFAGVHLEFSITDATAKYLQESTAAMNPVAMAQFFNTTCQGIFKHLLQAGSGSGGLFGPVSTYFGTVETNGHGMLHFHCLIWLQGTHHIAKLRQKLVEDSEFTASFLKFIDSIIKCSLHDLDDDVTSIKEWDIAAAVKQNYLTEFSRQLARNSNQLAAKCQVHSLRHNATCFKYGVPGTKNCRFNFPRPLVETTTINNLGTIDIQKNHVWVNPFNLTLMSITRSNHDVNCIPSNVKALALVRYITNYATEKDCSQYQRVMGAAFVQKSLEKKAENTMRGDPGLSTPNLDHKFCLKTYNRLAYDREISGPFAASTLLGLPEFYTPDRQMQKLNLYSLRSRLSKMLKSNSSVGTDNSQGRESCVDPDEDNPNGLDLLVPFQITTGQPSSMFDNYY